MSTPARPRKVKRQKQEHIDATTIEREETTQDWTVKANEALAFRDHSMAKLAPSLPDMMSFFHNSHIVLDGEEHPPISWTPEKIVSLIAEGKLESRTVTEALLQKASAAAKLVSPKNRCRLQPLTCHRLIV